ncbi:MAG: AI-2E family transporter [Deltaproteobacteria bacterium]|nr:AI-2E family transporter [Deltaproteobacteria bacterium]
MEEQATDIPTRPPTAPPTAQPTALGVRIEARGLMWLGAVALLLAVLYLARAALTPILVALAIAYLLDPLADRLEALKVPRVVATVLLLVTALLAVVAIALLIIPAIVRESMTFAEKLPDAVSTVLAKVETTFQVQLPRTMGQAFDEYATSASGLLADGARSLWNLFAQGFSGALGLLGAMITILFAPIFAFFYLRDFNAIVAFVDAHLPPRWAPTVRAYAGEFDRVLSRVVRGQLLVATILATYFSIALSSIGLELGVAIGILAGYCNLVPMMSGTVGITLSLLMCLLSGAPLWRYVAVLLVFAIASVAEATVLTPRIVGQQAGLSPVLVIMAVLIGGAMFGFVGVLLAVPLAALLAVVARHALASYRQRVLQAASGGQP